MIKQGHDRSKVGNSKPGSYIYRSTYYNSSSAIFFLYCCDGIHIQPVYSNTDIALFSQEIRLPLAIFPRSFCGTPHFLTVMSRCTHSSSPCVLPTITGIAASPHHHCWLFCIISLSLPLNLLQLIFRIVTMFFNLSLLIMWPENNVCHSNYRTINLRVLLIYLTKSADKKMRTTQDLPSPKISRLLCN